MQSLQQQPNTDAPTPNTQHPTPVLLAVRDAWDKLGLVVGVSLTWALLLATLFSLERLVPRALPMPFHIGLLGLMLALLLPLLIAGAVYVAHLVVIRDEVTYADFWRGGVRLYPQSLLLTVCHFVVEGVLAANIWFYGHVGHVSGYAIMLLCLYALLFWSLMAVCHFPLLVAQDLGVFDEPDKPAKRGVFAVFRRAFYLVLGRPFAVLGLLALCAVITFAFIATGVLFILIGPGLLALLVTHSVRALLIHFGVVAPPPLPEAVVPDAKFRLR